MKQVFKIDTNGFFIEPVIIEDNDSKKDCIDINPVGFYKAKWNGTKWIEGATQEYIDSFNKPLMPEPTELDILKQKQELMQKALDDLLLGGAL